MRLGRHASGLAASALALLGGFWLLAAPWLLGYQAGVASGWTGATRTDFWTGAGVVVVALATMWGYATTLAVELRSGTRRAPAPSTTADHAAPAAAPASSAPTGPEAAGDRPAPGGAAPPAPPATLGDQGPLPGAVAAEAAARPGAEPAVAGPAALPAPAGVTLRAVTTALEMHAAVMEATAEPAAIAVGAAAVADFRPAEVSPVKIKRPHAEGAEAVLRLVANPDIIAAVGRGRRAAVVVGFSAEAGLGPEEAERKLHAKRLDLCVWNDVREADSGFGAESERAVLVDAAGGREDLGLLPKRALAERILDRAEALLRAAGTRP